MRSIRWWVGESEVIGVSNGERPAFGLYIRAQEQSLWTLDGQSFSTREAAERQRERVVGQRRGRIEIAHATVIEFPSAADVQLFIRVGKEKEAVPAQASPVLRAVPRPVDTRRSKAQPAGRAGGAGA
jgi:hypothetical protein